MKLTIMNYKELLKKYMSVIIEKEGITYINDNDFTEEEVRELQNIAYSL